MFTIDPVGMIEVTGDYRLHVHFLDGVIRQIDLEPILQGGFMAHFVTRNCLPRWHSIQRWV